jgi:hypothetical protein
MTRDIQLLNKHNKWKSKAYDNSLFYTSSWGKLNDCNVNINQSTEGAEFVWVSCRMSERWRLSDYKTTLFLYSATNAFQRFNCSRFAIRLIATLISNPMFIWLKQFEKNNELSQLGSELRTSRFLSERAYPSTTVNSMLMTRRKSYNC